MALTLAHTDEATGATNPEAYFKIGHVVFFSDPKEGVVIHMHQYASEAARKAGKAPLPGPAPEFWVRNWTEPIERIRQEPREVPAPDPTEGEERAAPTTVMAEVRYTEQIPHNDFDQFFADDVFMKGGTTPTKQAYLYVKVQPQEGSGPDWSKAVDA